MTGIAWTSLGTANKPFSGSINDNSHTISGLSDPLIYQYSVSESESRIENLKLTVDNARAAGLIAVLEGRNTTSESKLTIDNVEVSGTIQGFYGNAKIYGGESQLILL